MTTIRKKLILLILIIQPFLVWATNYTSTTNGNWSSSSTWSPSGVPGSSDNVTIANTVTLDANENVNSITINSSKTLTVSSSNTLTVYGNFTNNGTFTYTTGTVTFVGSVNQTIGGSSTTTFYNLTANPSASTDTVSLSKAIHVNNNLTISQGVFACSTFSITGNTTGTMSMASGTTLVLGLPSSSTLPAFPSTFTNANISLDPASTVIYQANNTSTGQTVSAVPYYGNLIITTSSAGTSGASLFYVRTNISIGSGVTFKMNSTTDSIKGNITIASSGYYESMAVNSYFWGNISNNGIFSNEGYFYFYGNTNQTITGSVSQPINYFFIEMIPEPKATTDTLFIEGNIQVSQGINNTGTVVVPAAYNDSVEIGGHLTNHGTYTALNGVTYFYNGAGAHEILYNPVTVHQLTIATALEFSCNTTVTSDYTHLSGNLTLGDTLFLAGNFIHNTTGTVSGGMVCMNGNHNQTIGGTYAPNMTIWINQASATDTVKLADSVNFYGVTITRGVLDVTSNNYSINDVRGFTNNGTFLAHNGTVYFTPVYSYSIGGSSTNPFNNVVCQSSSGGTVSMASSQTIKGNFSINSVYFDENYNLTVGGNITNNGSFASLTGSVTTLNGNANQIIGGTHSLTFYNLIQKQASATDTVFLGEGITVSHNLADSGGVFDCQNYQIIGNNSGTFTMASGTNMLLGSASSSTNVAFPTLFTTAHTTLNSASTMSYVANTAQTISSTPTTYGNLTLGSGSSTTRKTPASSPLAIAGNLNIAANTTLVENTGTINLTGNLTNADSLVFTTGALNISGNFINNGMLTAGTGTVTLNGTAGQTIGGSAVTAFYNLTGSSSGTETITLGNSETVSHNFLISSGTFTLAGASYNLNVAGNFTNNSSLTASSGTVVMNGSGTQTIGGSAVSNFYNLTVNGTSSTVVNLGNNQKISQNLNVSTGSLNTSTYHIN
jgi:fibronectin-binding autotransporter adhesin